jgi:hypothetical protein
VLPAAASPCPARAELEKAAASRTSLYVHPNKQDTGQSLSRAFAIAGNGLEPESIEVQIVPLADYLGGGIDLLKLDVEGAELEALRGAGAALASVRTVIIEYHRVPESPPHEVLRVLGAAGLRCEMPRAPDSKICDIAMIRTTRAVLPTTPDQDRPSATTEVPE